MGGLSGLQAVRIVNVYCFQMLMPLIQDIGYCANAFDGCGKYILSVFMLFCLYILREVLCLKF